LAWMQDTRAAGRSFNPWHEACGFYPQDEVGRHRRIVNLAGVQTVVTDGQKRLYERLVRFAGKNGSCYPSQQTLALELGKSDRQVRNDIAALLALGLIRTIPRNHRRSNTYEFLWHPIFSERKSASSQLLNDPSVGRNPSSAQLHTLNGRVGRLSGNPRAIEGKDASSNIISGNRIEKSSGASHLQNLSRESHEGSIQSHSVDDDDLAEIHNPEFTFRLRMNARHGGGFDVERLLKLIKRDLNGTALTEFLRLDERVTTAPQSLRNPAGHYRKLARDLSREAGLIPLTDIQESFRKFLDGMQAHERAFSTSNAQKCPTCNGPIGKGVVFRGGELAPCDVCATPEWAEHVRKQARRDQNGSRQNPEGADS
jgi:hypothetical protein